jgi:hypothetical protein
MISICKKGNLEEIIREIEKNSNCLKEINRWNETPFSKLCGSV